ncbi:hypothetical protein [Dictyobacter arantiisoli]|uniref:DUF642 domain-containing protein n=1 Tax=Dictyobacter arantiisoli TaxID=2014874 RepID=A0A5A5T6G3_9CHLR|nr:hypothetical protein [Dictyobacter arantiisoli]GCF06947.1 hypothetical protein KDI_05110 [Dictyobacter arantiisoli]
MNRRFILITLLALLLIGGFVANTNAHAIQSALIVPMAIPGKQPTHSIASSTSTPTQKTPGKIQPTGQNRGTMQIASTPLPTNILAQDTFQRNNQPLWGLATDGRSWDGDANTSQAFSINAATGQVSNAHGTVNAILGPSSDNVDVQANGMVNQFGNGVNMGVVLRWSNAQNWYKALIDGNHLSILKRVNGASTQVQAVPFHAKAGQVYTLRFQAIGVMLFAKVWPLNTQEPAQWMITVSDSALKDGKSGFRFVLQPTTVINMTSFQVTPATMGTDL